MLQTRVIPTLLLKDEVLVKTIKFKNPNYIGDPINTCRIFNELEADELAFIDIRSTLNNKPPNFKILREISSECFMPLSYGGGITNLQQIEEILKIGFEKVILNTAALLNPKLISDASSVFGSQAIVVAIDTKKNIFGRHQVFGKSGKIKFNLDPIFWAKRAEDLGAGELLHTSIDREGTWSGYEIPLLKKITDQLNIPVIANGGAGAINHLHEAIEIGRASSIAIGSMVVYQRKGRGVLINFPHRDELIFK